MKHMNTGLLLLAVLICTAGAFAQSPKTISFQGVLQDANGNVIPDGNHKLQLALYRPRPAARRCTVSSKPFPLPRASSTF